jgi:hypothetical protein
MQKEAKRTKVGAISTTIYMMKRKGEDDWNPGRDEGSLGVCGVLFLPAEQTRTVAAICALLSNTLSLLLLMASVLTFSLNWHLVNSHLYTFTF